MSPRVSCSAIQSLVLASSICVLFSESRIRSIVYRFCCRHFLLSLPLLSRIPQDVFFCRLEWDSSRQISISVVAGGIRNY